MIVLYDTKQSKARSILYCFGERCEDKVQQCYATSFVIFEHPDSTSDILYDCPHQMTRHMGFKQQTLTHNCHGISHNVKVLIVYYLPCNGDGLKYFCCHDVVCHRLVPLQLQGDKSHTLYLFLPPSGAAAAEMETLTLLSSSHKRIHVLFPKQCLNSKSSLQREQQLVPVVKLTLM